MIPCRLLIITSAGHGSRSLALCFSRLTWVKLLHRLGGSNGRPAALTWKMSHLGSMQTTALDLSWKRDRERASVSNWMRRSRSSQFWGITFNTSGGWILITWRKVILSLLAPWQATKRCHRKQIGIVSRLSEHLQYPPQSQQLQRQHLRQYQQHHQRRYH